MSDPWSDRTETLPRPPGYGEDWRGRRRRRRGGGLFSMLVAALVAGVVAAAVAVPIARQTVADEQGQAPVEGSPTSDDPAAGEGTTAEDPAPAQAGELLSVAEIAESVLPSAARVDVPGGSGSAVVYREDGYLITNNHVVDGATQVQVTLADGDTVDAEIVGTAAFTDLAVLRIDEEGLPTPTYADEVPKVGSLAVAVGSPFGLDATVTAGVVSALNRELATRNTILAGLVQTDAAINPGNSGGALVDGDGQVIGINTAIASPSGTGNIGIGFAIPVTTVVPIAEQLIAEGEVTRAFLGVAGQDIDPRVADLYGLGVTEGAVVTQVVPDGPADEAGLQRGDIITQLNGEEVDSFLSLAGRIQTLQPGTVATLTYVRDGDEREATITLAEHPDDE